MTFSGGKPKRHSRKGRGKRVSTRYNESSFLAAFDSLNVNKNADKKIKKEVKGDLYDLISSFGKSMNVTVKPKTKLERSRKVKMTKSRVGVHSRKNAKPHHTPMSRSRSRSRSRSKSRSRSRSRSRSSSSSM